MIQTREIVDKVFEKLQEDLDNCLCVDCGESSAIFVSISHGSFICPVCVNYHNALGSLSNIKNILNNDWTIPELRKIVSGGNSALKEFMNHYQISQFPIETKYKTRAMSVYRKMLNETAEGRNYEEELPSLDSGKELENSDQLDWVKGILLKSRTIGSQALNRLENIGKNTKIRVDELNRHIRNSSFTQKTAEMIGKLTGDAGNSFADKAKMIKNETLIFLHNVEDMIACKKISSN